jgi:hypothetical protein
MLDGGPLEFVRLELGMTMLGLWTLCFGLGGSLSLAELSAYLGGQSRPPVEPVEHDVIAQVLNEALIDRHLAPRLDYSTP